MQGESLLGVVQRFSFSNLPARCTASKTADQRHHNHSFPLRNHREPVSFTSLVSDVVTLVFPEKINLLSFLLGSRMIRIWQGAR